MVPYNVPIVPPPSHTSYVFHPSFGNYGSFFGVSPGLQNIPLFAFDDPSFTRLVPQDDQFPLL